LVGEELLCQEFVAAAQKIPPLTMPATHHARRSGSDVLRASGHCVAARLDIAEALTRPVTPRPGSSRGRVTPVATSPEPSIPRILEDMSLTAHARAPNLWQVGKAGTAGTMRERAQRAALKVAPGNVHVSQEYVTAFGPKRELPRTPQKHLK
jgi:hypothetical protein